MSIDQSADLQWQRHLVLGLDQGIFVRPIAWSDDLMIRDLLAHVSREDLRLRFFDSIREFSPQFIAGLINIGGLYVTALVAIDEASSEMLGVVWLYADALRKTGEYAILLRSDLKGKGLGWDLMQLIIEYAKSQGLSRIDGQVLQENSVMLKMCRELGFEVKTDARDRGVCNVALCLNTTDQQRSRRDA